MASKVYTAQEMRSIADSDDFSAYGYDDPKYHADADCAEVDVTQMVREMLHQAADMMERMQSVVRECNDIIKQTEKCMSCSVCKDGPRKMFRSRYCWQDYSFGGCNNHIGVYAQAQIDLAKRIRREVGEREEVKDGE